MASARRELQVGDLRMDPAKRQVWRGEEEVELSAKEFAVLEVFMRRPGEVLSRFQLLEHAWDYEYENRSNIVDSYVRLLRRKIDKPFGRRVDPDRARRGLPPARERRRFVTRIPIRLRMTLAFTIVMAVLLAALGFFVYSRFETELSEQIDQSLRSHGDDIASLVAARGSEQDREACSGGRRASLRCSRPSGGIYATTAAARRSTRS